MALDLEEGKMHFTLTGNAMPRKELGNKEDTIEIRKGDK
jgi:hypothetical protein